GYFSLNLSANSVMRGRLDARRTLKSLVADLRLYTLFPETNQYLASFLKETSLQNKLLLKGYVTLWHIIVFIKSLVKIILRKN
ncbi:MAG: hypothetical protein KH057_09260, partial [Bacteroides sp.]|nr:hypothetical protein [Bacteroides sp.]